MTAGRWNGPLMGLLLLAAAALGASEWTTFRRIVLPNLGPAIISGCALAFAREVELPVDVIREQITARYVDGMLWIELPKK